jgi:hypothetical protein
MMCGAGEAGTLYPVDADAADAEHGDHVAGRRDLRRGIDRIVTAIGEAGLPDTPVPRRKPAPDGSPQKRTALWEDRNVVVHRGAVVDARHSASWWDVSRTCALPSPVPPS